MPSRREAIKHGKRFALGAAVLVNVFTAIVLSFSGYHEEVMVGIVVIFGTATAYLAGTIIMDLWNRRTA